MIIDIKRALKLRRARKEIQLLDAAAECLNKIRTSVPDDCYAGENEGAGGKEIKTELKATALILDESLRSLLESCRHHRSSVSKTAQEPEEVTEGLLGSQNV